MFSRRWWWTTLILLAAIAVMVRLGFWQLDRLAQRKSANTHLRSMQAAPVLPLSGDALSQDLTSMEYRAVTATGRYDFEYQVAIRNQVWTQSWGDDPGYALLTPLILENGQGILVERGWIPAEYTTPETWRQFDEAGTISVMGIIRLPTEKPEMGSVKDPTLAPEQTRLDFWNLVNIERLQQQIPYLLLPVYIQQTPKTSQTSLLNRSIPTPDLSDGPHLGFALMWFFYATLVLFGYPVYLRKQER
jgi:surfeit locus 1 family protein